MYSQTRYPIMEFYMGEDFVFWQNENFPQLPSWWVYRINRWLFMLKVKMKRFLECMLKNFPQSEEWTLSSWKLAFPGTVSKFGRSNIASFHNPWKLGPLTGRVSGVIPRVATPQSTCSLCARVSTLQRFPALEASCFAYGTRPYTLIRGNVARIWYFAEATACFHLINSLAMKISSR